MKKANIFQIALKAISNLFFAAGKPSAKNGFEIDLEQKQNIFGIDLKQI